MSRAARALTAAVLLFAAVTTVVGQVSGAPLQFLVADLALGVSFVVAGGAAAALRPASPTGPMLLVAGGLWFVGSYAPSGQPVVTHLGFAFESYYDLVLAALLVLLSSPMQRLRPVWPIAALATGMVVRSSGRLLLQDPGMYGCTECEPNPFGVWPSIAAFELIEIATSLAIALFAVIIAFVAVHRLMRSGPVWRRVRGPVLVAGGVAMSAAAYDAAEYAWTTATRSPLFDVGEPASTILPWMVFGARTLVPIGFLAATLRARSAPGALAPFAAGLERGSANLGDALRTALGDSSLDLMRPGPDGTWLTEQGDTVSLRPDRARAITRVGSASQPVGLLVHDPALLEQPELLGSVVRVLRLALENERLESELRVQLQEITDSRQRLVMAGEEERRRLERDLHDGAQQRLIGVTLALQQVRTTAGLQGLPDSVRVELDAAAHETAAAIRELRELARGVHPAILDDAGLEAAVTALARRVGMPVEVDVELDGRLPRLLESTVYFAIAEALTNAHRHAAATRAIVRVVHADGSLEVEIGDDGRGGADPERGSGLRGLTDRLQALGGQLVVDSPPAGGTRICATIPLR